MDELLPYDLHLDLLTYAQGAELAGVAEGTIRTWVHRNRLAKTDTADGPRVKGIDVLRARATSAGARRTPLATARAGRAA